MIYLTNPVSRLLSRGAANNFYELLGYLCGKFVEVKFLGG